MTHDIALLLQRHDPPRLKVMVMVVSFGKIGDKVERESPFCITSLLIRAVQLGAIVRSHGASENSLHWVMDMSSPGDECRVRTDHAPANFTTIKHIALNLPRKAPDKDSLCHWRKVAAWDDNSLTSLITACVAGRA